MTAGPAQAADDSVPQGEQASPTLLEQMGGVSGIVASTIPVVVFVVVCVPLVPELPVLLPGPP